MVLIKQNKEEPTYKAGKEGATFDAKQYLANYADLREAFGTDEDAARKHFKEYGSYEGRIDMMLTIKLNNTLEITVKRKAGKTPLLMN